jgi:hypothetical protein
VTVAPGDFEIPDGVGVVGFSVVDGLTVIVGDDGVIRVYDSESRPSARNSFWIDEGAGGTASPA